MINNNIISLEQTEVEFFLKITDAVIPRRFTYVRNAFDENASYRYYDGLCASDAFS